MDDVQIFLSAPPGLEPLLAAEAAERGFANPTVQPGGVEISGDRSEAMRANLELRGAGSVLLRLASFRAAHLSELDKRARRIEWGALLRSDVPLRLEAVCRKSRIYHSGAAAQRVGDAIQDAIGAEIRSNAPLTLMIRIEKDLCTVSIDTSGAPLHKRGHKQAVGKAPLRETLAALFLRSCCFSGGEAVADPMCGSGTIPIEAAEIAAGLEPGRDRSFAFEHLVGFNAEQWADMRAAPPIQSSSALFYGSDRDTGAVASAQANAERAGVAALTRFEQRPISDFQPPSDAPGLVLANPPYGGRIGDTGKLKPLYAALGAALKERFSGWRVGVVTSEQGLARATGLDFAAQTPPIPHGPLKIRLYRTDRL